MQVLKSVEAIKPSKVEISYPVRYTILDNLKELEVFCENGDVNTVLIDWGKTKNFLRHRAREHKYTLLHYAVLSSMKEAIGILRKYNASIDFETTEGKTPYDLAMKENGLRINDRAFLETLNPNPKKLEE